jgi:hypothetical protein
LNNSEILFEEKQYLGHNRFSIVVRTTLAMFCFIGYYWSENPKPVEVSFVKIGSYPIQNISNSGLIFFILGISILVFSACLTYVLHIHTSIYKGHVTLDGFWTSRAIRIELKDIVSIKKCRYKKSLLRRAVYNLHNLGTIRFYTSGEDFIELIDNKGHIYKIGTQKIQEMHRTLKKAFSN